MFQAITFSNNGPINGWVHTGSTSQFICHQTGLYLVEYDALANPSTTEPATVSFRAVTGGGATEVAASQRGMTLVTVNAPRSVSTSFLANFNNSDILQFQLLGSAAGSQITPNGTGVTRPSISTTITRIL